jgi:hypothetical protein
MYIKCNFLIDILRGNYFIRIMFTHAWKKGWFFMMHLLLLVPASAMENEAIAELKTLNGKIYHDAYITKVTPSEIRIMHESGAARISLKDLPDDLKAKFGYDPEKAEAHLKALGDAEKKAAEAEKNKAEKAAILKGAKPGIFIVDRYAGEDGSANQGLLVYACTPDALNRISELRDLNEGNLNIVTTGQGGGYYAWASTDKQYLLVGLPKKNVYIQNTSVGGMFVKAGAAKLSNGSAIQVFRFVGLGKTDNIGFDTIYFQEYGK